MRVLVCVFACLPLRVRVCVVIAIAAVLCRWRQAYLRQIPPQAAIKNAFLAANACVAIITLY